MKIPCVGFSELGNKLEIVKILNALSLEPPELGIWGFETYARPAASSLSQRWLLDWMEKILPQKARFQPLKHGVRSNRQLQI